MGKPQGGKLTVYVDCVSPYSWFAFTNIIRFRPQLAAHGVTVDIIPFFLGGARDGVGNPFTPTPKAKEPFAKQDSETTGRLLGLEVNRPKDFPILSLFAVRVANYIKDHYPASKFEATFPALASGYWSKGINISTPEGIIQAITSENIFSVDEVKSIMKQALAPENKKRVLDLTMGSGAFGAPWIVAVDGDGVEKEFFGNDRWDHIFEHLGVPYSGVRVLGLEQPEGKGKARL